MAARVLLQRRAAPLTAAMLVGTVAFYPRTSHAEAPSSDRQLARKPIYDDDFDALPPPPKSEPTLPPSTEAPTPTLPSSSPSSPTSDLPSLPSTHGPTPTDRLAAQIRRARLFAYSQACIAEDAVNDVMSRAFALEQSFTSTLASLAPPRESGERLMPGLVYVLVAGMAGSIVARRRGIMLRGVTPLAFGLGAAWTVIPITMGNVAALTWEYEKKVPAVAEAHLKAREEVENAVRLAKVHAELAQQKVHDGVRSAREKLEEWVKQGK
ncbi:hypothetical protein VTJ49DRAFT_7231 [Mycothermus thermophilus]|uniref:MICOS complex subunit n=1 Tax=Humicola insolens TaxID=85995 RepID=A0ABR3VII9_HUMIN